MKKTLALLLAVALIVGFMPVTAKADNELPDPVKVYLSISDNEVYVDTSLVSNDPRVMAFQELNVPYFDIGYYYGLEDFYYTPHCYDAQDYNPLNQGL